jgi:hypothetical protein
VLGVVSVAMQAVKGAAGQQYQRRGLWDAGICLGREREALEMR